MLDALLYPDGSPILTVAAWSIAAFVGFVAWVLLSVPLWLFYQTFKMITQDALSWMWRNVVLRVFNFAAGRVSDILTAFKSLAEPDKLIAVLPPRIEAMRKAARGSRKRVAQHFANLQRRAGAVLAGDKDTLARVNGVIRTLERFERIAPSEIRSSGGPGGAIVRLILFTAFMAFAVSVNTFLLEQFFRSLTSMPVPYINVSLSVVLAFAYSIFELLIGFALESAHQKRVNDEEADGPSVMEIILFGLIVTAIVIEIGFYTILGFEFRWPWEGQSGVPFWLDGWFGLMGLLIGGGVSVAGYFWGDCLHSLTRELTISKLRSTIAALPGHVDAAREVWRRANEAGASPRAASGPDGGLTDHVRQLEAQLRRVESAQIHEASHVKDVEADYIAMGSLGLAVVGVAAVICNALVFSDYLQATPVGSVGAWAPPLVGAMAGIWAMFAGDVLRGEMMIARITRATGDQSLSVASTGVLWTRIIGLALVAPVLGAALAAGSRNFTSWPAMEISIDLTVVVGSIAFGAFSWRDMWAGIFFIIRSFIQAFVSLLGGFFGVLLIAPLALVKLLELLLAFVALPTLAFLNWRASNRAARGPTGASSHSAAAV